MSYRATLDIVDKLGHKWQEEVVEGTSKEKNLTNQISMIRESIDLLCANPEVNVDLIFQLSDKEQELEIQREMMHPGYYFVGDYVDMRTTVRHMTLLNQNKDHHMYQICAYVNRVSGNHLQNITPKANFETEPFTTLMPSLSDREKLAEEFAFLVAKVWTKYMPHFKVYEPVLPSYIKHAYLKEMRQKTKRVGNTIS